MFFQRGADKIRGTVNNLFDNPFKDPIEGGLQGLLISNILIAVRYSALLESDEEFKTWTPAGLTFMALSTLICTLIGYIRENNRIDQNREPNREPIRPHR